MKSGLDAMPLFLLDDLLIALGQLIVYHPFFSINFAKKIPDFYFYLFLGHGV